MHELSIAMSILELAAEHAAERSPRRPARLGAIHVRVGPLSGVLPEALMNAFALAREDSPFPNAALVIESTAVLIRCPACAADRPVISLQELRCAACGGVGEITGGNELDLLALEVMDVDANSPGGSPAEDSQAQ